MKLSKTQAEVVYLMQNGWELACSQVFCGRSWLQQGGAGHGGKSKDVHRNTFQALINKGVIILNVRKFPTATYRLTDEFKQTNKQS